MQVSEGIHRLTQGVTNFYLIEESGKYTSGRCRDPGRLGVLRALARRTRRQAGRPRRGAAHPRALRPHRVRRAGPHGGRRAGCGSDRADEESARTGQAGKHDGKITSYLLRAAFYRTTFSLLRRGGGRMIPIAEVSAFADGEQIDVPGRPRAVHAPGHTPGSAAILVESRRALLTGDVMATENPAHRPGAARRSCRPG